MRTARVVFVRSLLLALLIFSSNIVESKSLMTANPFKTLKQEIALGYEQRIAADPSFKFKSCAEVLIAASTQFSAEWQQRGVNLLPEIDFVVAAILTAVFGKYYSMWKVAKTVDSSKSSLKQKEPRVFGMAVPTNAFQKTMMDGVTRPTFKQRVGSIIAPMPNMFQAGFLASTAGYGLTALMIIGRSILMPSYVAATRNINILYASIFTGFFIAVVSNIRYQVLQGIIEPAIAAVFGRVPVLRDVLFMVIRIANGLLGSMLSIAGMKMLGLQRLK